MTARIGGSNAFAALADSDSGESSCSARSTPAPRSTIPQGNVAGGRNQKARTTTHDRAAAAASACAQEKEEAPADRQRLRDQIQGKQEADASPAGTTAGRDEDADASATGRSSNKRFLSLPGGVAAEVVEPGVGARRVKVGDVVEVKYKVFLVQKLQEKLNASTTFPSGTATSTGAASASAPAESSKNTTAASPRSTAAPTAGSCSAAAQLHRFSMAFLSATDRGVKPTDKGEVDWLVGSAGAVIPGFDRAVRGMVQGEVRKIFVPAKQGYGKKGAASGKIPKNADLLFVAELVKVGIDWEGENNLLSSTKDGRKRRKYTAKEKDLRNRRARKVKKT